MRTLNHHQLPAAARVVPIRWRNCAWRPRLTVRRRAHRLAAVGSRPARPGYRLLPVGFRLSGNGYRLFPRRRSGGRAQAPAAGRVRRSASASRSLRRHHQTPRKRPSATSSGNLINSINPTRTRGSRSPGSIIIFTPSRLNRSTSV